MSTITTRSGKGSALTHTEMDNNFTNLNTDKVETKGTLTKTFANNETAAITLSSALPSGHIPVVSVSKDAQVDGLVESSWDVNSTGSNYENGDGTTYNVTLTSANAGHTPYNLQWDGVTANTAGDLATILSDGAGGVTGPSPGYDSYLRLFKFVDSGNKIIVGNTAFTGFMTYNLSTPYDPSTAVLANTHVINWANISYIGGSNWMYAKQDIEFDDDGDRLWLMGNYRQYSGSTYYYYTFVQEFSLNIPFVITDSNLTHVGNTNPSGLFGGSAGYAAYRGWYKDSGLYVQDAFYCHHIFDNVNTTSAVGVSTTNDNGYSILRRVNYNTGTGLVGQYSTAANYGPPHWCGPMSDDLQRVVGKYYSRREVMFFDYNHRRSIGSYQNPIGDYDPNADLSTSGPYGQYLTQEPFRQWYSDNGGTFSTSTLFNNYYNNMLDADPDGKLFFFYPKIGRVYSMTGAHISKARFKRSSGTWSANDVGKVIVGNGGKAILTATDGSYEIIDPFDNTDPITSWTLEDFSVKSDAEGFELASTSSTYDFTRAHINPDHVNPTTVSTWPNLDTVNRVGGTFDSVDYYPVNGINANNEVSILDTTFKNGNSITLYVRGLCWGNDGNIVCFYDSGSNKIYTVELNRPYDLIYNTPVTSTTKILDPVSASDVRQMQFSTDGDKFFYALDQNVVSFELTTNWDIGSANTATKYTKTGLATGSTYTFFDIKPDGTKMWAMGYQTNGTQKNIYEYNMSTPWDLSTATLLTTHTTAAARLFEGLRGSGNVTGEEYLDHYYTYGCFEWSNDGKYLFVQRYNRESSQQGRTYLAKFGVKTAWDITTGYYTGQILYSITGDHGASVINWVFATRTMKGGDGSAMLAGVAITTPDIDKITVIKTGGKNYLTGYHTAITGSTAQIDTTNWNDINGVTVTEDKGSGDIYYSFSTDNRTTWKIIHNTDGERSIARNNGGTWQYNSNITYATATWSDAAINSEKGAIEEAISLSVNRMDKTQFEAVSDANHITMGSTLDLAITYNLTSSGLTSPSSDGVSLNYAGSTGDQGAILGTDYNWVLANTTTVEVTALAPANLKVRIV